MNVDAAGSDSEEWCIGDRETVGLRWIIFIKVKDIWGVIGSVAGIIQIGFNRIKIRPIKFLW